MKQLITAAFLSTAFASQAMAAKYIPAEPTPVAPAPVKPAAASPAAAVTSTPPVRSAAATTPAPAIQAARTTPATPPFNLGWYMGAQVGDSTIGALIGYQFSKMYAMEASYDYVDPVRTSTSTTKTSLEISRIGVSGLAMFPIKFSEMGPMAIYIKVGYARTTEIYTVNDAGLGIPAFPATTTVTTTLKTGVTGGAGVQVDLSNNTTARLGVNYVGGDRSVYLNAIYKF